LPLLGPVDRIDMLIYGAEKNGDAQNTGLATRFPESMLSLLDRVIPTASVAPERDLRTILDKIIAADPTLRQDQRWRRLDAIAG
jgi:hypothetical protein